jgi:hypothetical protein
MQVTTIAEARALVGRTFERDGELRVVVDAETLIWRGGVRDVGIGYANRGAVRYMQRINKFSDWLSGATEVTEGSVSE